MISGTCFTVPFERGKVVIHTSAEGRVLTINLDLDDQYDEKSTVSKPGV